MSLGLSGAVALFGHFGIEWDLTAVDDATREEIAEWVRLAKRLRPLIATGRMIHVDGTDPGIDVRGMVAADAASAVFTITQIETSIAYPAGRIRLPGLDNDRLYRRAPPYDTRRRATKPVSPRSHGPSTTRSSPAANLRRSAFAPPCSTPSRPPSSN